MKDLRGEGALALRGYAPPPLPDAGQEEATASEQGVTADAAADEGAESAAAAGARGSGDEREPAAAPSAPLPAEPGAGAGRAVVLRDATVAMQLYDAATQEALALTAREKETNSIRAWVSWLEKAKVSRVLLNRVFNWATSRSKAAFVDYNKPLLVLSAAETRLSEPGTLRTASSADIAAVGAVVMSQARAVSLGEAMRVAGFSEAAQRDVAGRVRALCTVVDARGGAATTSSVGETLPGTVPTDGEGSVEGMSALDAAALLLSTADSGGACDLGATTAAATGSTRQGVFDVAIAAGRDAPPIPCRGYPETRRTEVGHLGGMRGVAVTEEHLRALQSRLAHAVKSAVPVSARTEDGLVRYDDKWVLRLLQLRDSGVIDLLPKDVVAGYCASAAGSALVERLASTLRALDDVDGALDPDRTDFRSRVYGAACRSWVAPRSGEGTGAADAPPPPRSLRALSRPARDPSWQADIYREVRHGSAFAADLVSAVNEALAGHRALQRPSSPRE